MSCYSPNDYLLGGLNLNTRENTLKLPFNTLRTTLRPNELKKLVAHSIIHFIIQMFEIQNKIELL